jgi:hypothetical protein
MNRRDKALLNKQLWGVAARPPSRIGLALVAVFLGGILIGSTLFGRGSSGPAVAANDVTGSITKSAAHGLVSAYSLPCAFCAP